MVALRDIRSSRLDPRVQSSADERVHLRSGEEQRFVRQRIRAKTDFRLRYRLLLATGDRGGGTGISLRGHSRHPRSRRRPVEKGAETQWERRQGLVVDVEKEGAVAVRRKARWKGNAGWGWGKGVGGRGEDGDGQLSRRLAPMGLPLVGRLGIR